MTTKQAVIEQETLPAARISFGERGFEAKTDQDLMRIAEAFLKSGLAPQGLDSPHKVVIALQHCRELGLPFASGLQSICVINGRPSVYGAAALGMCMETGELEDIKETVEGAADALKAVCEVKRRGRSLHRQEFSVEDAKVAKLWGKAGPWQQFPKRMLQMRARGFALWDTFPDRLKGLMMAEIAQDIPAGGVEPRSLKAAFERSLEPSPAVAAVLEAGGDLPDVPTVRVETGRAALLAQARKLSEELMAAGNIEAGLLPPGVEGYTESQLCDLLAYMEESHPVNR